MIFNVITFILIIIGVYGTVNKNFNLIAICLSLNIIGIAIVINMIIFGGLSDNVTALVVGFYGIIIISLLNAITCTIIYVYFDKKNTLEVKETLRDM